MKAIKKVLREVVRYPGWKVEEVGSREGKEAQGTGKRSAFVRKWAFLLGVLCSSPGYFPGEGRSRYKVGEAESKAEAATALGGWLVQEGGISHPEDFKKVQGTHVVHLTSDCLW